MVVWIYQLGGCFLRDNAQSVKSKYTETEHKADRVSTLRLSQKASRTCG